MSNLRTSGVFNLGSLSGDKTITGPWTPSDITSATVVGWFDGENVNGGTSGNSGATSWVNQISGQNDLSFTGSPTVGTDNVRTVSASYLTEDGTPTLVAQQDEVGIYIAARVRSKGSAAFGAVIVTEQANLASDNGAWLFFKDPLWASYPEYNAWTNKNDQTVSYRTLKDVAAIYDVKSDTTSGYTVTFDGGRHTYSGTDANPKPASDVLLRFGRQLKQANRTTDTDFYQIVVVHGTLSSADEEKLYGYLAHKAGSASDLPSSNSYQSAAPTKTVGVNTRPTRRWGGITGRSLISNDNVPATGVLSLPEMLQASYYSAPAPDGLTAATAATSAEQILLDYPSSGDGIYYIQDGSSTKQVYCDMTNDGGGWMLYASFATNTNVTSGSYPAWLKNALSRTDMTTNASTYGLTDNSLNWRDGTSSGGGTGNAQFNDNAFYGPGYVFWDYQSGGVTGITMSTWFGPSSVDQLRVHWGRSASTYTSNPPANKIYTNNTLRAQITSASVGSSWRSDVVTFDPSGAAGTPLFLITEDQAGLDVNGIAAIWMR